MLAIRTVVHPTDFSESSGTAFELACALARDYGAKLVLVHVYPPPVTALEEIDWKRPDGFLADLSKEFHAIRPKDESIRITHRMMEGHAADGILEIASIENADMIVMGTHGRKGISRFLLGSTAEKICRNATCAVVTVRATISSSAFTSDRTSDPK